MGMCPEPLPRLMRHSFAADAAITHRTSDIFPGRVYKQGYSRV